jgi:hypothetical protein
MEKLYVNEIRPDGEVNTVGLFYSRGEAENIVAQLRSILEKADCRHEIVEAVTGPLAIKPTSTNARPWLGVRQLIPRHGSACLDYHTCAK